MRVAKYPFAHQARHYPASIYKDCTAKLARALARALCTANCEACTAKHWHALCWQDWQEHEWCLLLLCVAFERGARSGLCCFALSISLFVSVSVCLFVCCLFVFVSLFVCLFDCLVVCVFVCLFVCLFVCSFVHLFRQDGWVDRQDGCVFFVLLIVPCMHLRHIL